MSDQLDELEHRVAEKWAAVAGSRIDPRWQFDVTTWGLHPPPPLPPGTLQFPREQWARYPAKRAAVLLACERILDHGELTDEQWLTVCLAMQYGGKTLIA